MDILCYVIPKKLSLKMSKSFAPHSLNTVATYISRYQLVLNEVLATKWRTGT